MTFLTHFFVCLTNFFPPPSWTGLATSPLITLAQEAHPLWEICVLTINVETPQYLFHFVHFVILVNSLIIDMICYGRIINYMRKNRVRVTVIATTRVERLKSHNIITAPSSFLIWMVVIVSMIPSSIMLIKSIGNIKYNFILIRSSLILL